MAEYEIFGIIKQEVLMRQLKSRLRTSPELLKELDNLRVTAPACRHILRVGTVVGSSRLKWKLVFAPKHTRYHGFLVPAKIDRRVAGPGFGPWALGEHEHLKALAKKLRKLFFQAGIPADITVQSPEEAFGSSKLLLKL